MHLSRAERTQDLCLMLVQAQPCGSWIEPLNEPTDYHGQTDLHQRDSLGNSGAKTNSFLTDLSTKPRDQCGCHTLCWHAQLLLDRIPLDRDSYFLTSTVSNSFYLSRLARAHLALDSLAPV